MGNGSFNPKYKDCDFAGYVTRNDLPCADGRTIRHGAFFDQDGAKVPLCWNHDHKDLGATLGHMFLEKREDGMYGYGYFNDTEDGQKAKKIVRHGDVEALSIWANKLKQSKLGDVLHGIIREVSLCTAGANPGAYVDYIMAHSMSSPDEEYVDGIIANYDERIMLMPGIMHSETDEEEDQNVDTNNLYHADDEQQKEQTPAEFMQQLEDTIGTDGVEVVYGLIGQAYEDGKAEAASAEHSYNFEEGDDVMKHNVFENADQQEIKHSLTMDDQAAILDLARREGSLKHALHEFVDNDDELAHGWDEVDKLFPDPQPTNGTGAPEAIKRDQGWVSVVMNKVSKSPFPRIKTRWTDLRDLKASNVKNFTKGQQKKYMENLTMAQRVTTPTTVYIKDQLDRDDILDITDFDVVAYQQSIMKELLNEVLALTFLIGDGRDLTDEDKIKEDCIRPIWTENELFAIRGDIDVDAMKNELQGTNTGANFGASFIRAEAIITKLLYLRENYKGSGSPDLFISPHELNILMMARDMNGRRIRNSKAELASELNVANIYTVEQFAGKVREDSDHKKHKLLAICANLSDYQVGSAKGGEITSFKDFDIDFNKEKYLIETRLSGALTRFYSAIILEEPVAEG